MTGRRLLDVAAIFKASRGVAAKHVALRQHQFDLYSKTSSLAKAVKSQTDRVTLTVKAASVLAERFNGPGPNDSPRVSRSRDPAQCASTLSQEKVSGTSEESKTRTGVLKDHFYGKSDQNAPVETPPDGNLGVKQEDADRHPLPNGSIPPADTVEAPNPDKETYSDIPQTESVKAPLADGREETGEGLQPTSSGRSSIPNPADRKDSAIAEKSKNLQRQVDQQIPSQAVELPSTAYSEEPGSKADRDRNVFSTHTPSHGQAVSTLPGVNLPKNTEDVQKSDERVPDAQIEQQPFSQARGFPEQKQNFDESYTELFHSPRVARILGGQPKLSKPFKGLEMFGAQETPVKQTKSPQEKYQASFNIRTLGQRSQDGAQDSPNGIVDSRPQATGSEGVRELAADMAKDAEGVSADASPVSFV